MNLRVSNALNAIGSLLTVANDADYKTVWSGKEPADFGADLAKLDASYGAVLARAAQAGAAGTGAADAKATAESALEDAAFLLARALANHCKKTGDAAGLAKADLTKTAIVRLRNQDLAARATEIRDLAAAAQAEEGAAGRGVTAARVATLTGAIDAFKQVMNLPRGQIVTRSTLLKENETDTAALLELADDMTDLVIQFDGTEQGRRFIAAWKRARLIVDLGGTHGNGGGDTPPPAPSAPAPASST